MFKRINQPSRLDSVFQRILGTFLKITNCRKERAKTDVNHYQTLNNANK